MGSEMMTLLREWSSSWLELSEVSSQFSSFLWYASCESVSRKGDIPIHSLSRRESWSCGPIYYTLIHSRIRIRRYSAILYFVKFTNCYISCIRNQCNRWLHYQSDQFYSITILITGFYSTFGSSSENRRCKKQAQF